MAYEAHISPIPFIKGNNLGHVFNKLVFNYPISEPKCKQQLQSTQWSKLSITKSFCADICVVKNINTHDVAHTIQGEQWLNDKALGSPNEMGNRKFAGRGAHYMKGSKFLFSITGHPFQLRSHYGSSSSKQNTHSERTLTERKAPSPSNRKRSPS